MAILIDGYNLIHSVGLIPRRIGPRTLERSRRALLNSLANHLGPEHVNSTTVVFDAKDSRPDAASSADHRGITVLFAHDHEEADELIEQLIRHDSAPRQLVVVSSDHQIQQAARRRGAQAVDSETWYDQLERTAQNTRHQPPIEVPEKPEHGLSASEVESWLQDFGIADDDAGDSAKK